MYRKCYGTPTEIRMYMKNRSKFGYSAKVIFNDIQALFGDNAVSYRSVSRWTKKFREGLESVENKPGTGRKVSNHIKSSLHSEKKTALR